MIPGEALAKLDIRTAKIDLKANNIIKILQNELEKQGAELGEYQILNALAPKMTEKQKLEEFKQIVEEVLNKKVKFIEAKDCGYGDSAMLYEKYKVPTASFGPRPDKMAHQANEYVLIDDLEKCARVFTKTIKYYCS